VSVIQTSFDRAHLKKVLAKLPTCKGNLAVPRKSLRLAREDPKKIYKKDIYMRSVCTTDLAREDPKRIL
jgi:hypothetical protein